MAQRDMPIKSSDKQSRAERPSQPKRPEKDKIVLLVDESPLHIPEHLEEPGYHYHWTNDTRNNLRQRMRQGYTHVMDGDEKYWIYSGSHKDEKAYLMKIPMNIYEGIQKAKIERNKQALEARSEEAKVIKE